MGFNLGLRDVASLAELVAEGRGELDTVADVYDSWRAADRREVIAFTDGLVRLFASPWGPVRRLRNLGLLAFDLLPPAKAALSGLSTGAGGRIPKLARGVPIRAAS
jgi:2-octaprenyl-6-methoxyphenol hydroxylase